MQSNNQRYIFTITTGRSGTRSLSTLLNCFPGVTSEHEPDPSFSVCMREIQSQPGLAIDFLRNEKLPAIERSAKNGIYAETSHLFGKGFLDAWLQIPELNAPDLILLDRSPRSVSLSMTRIGSLPARSESGLRFCLSPEDETCLTRLDDWNSLTDYQLCYWYCLEIKERKAAARNAVEARGGRVLQTSLKRLRSRNGYLELKKTLALPSLGPIDAVKYLMTAYRRGNAKRRYKAAEHFSDATLDRFESEVRERIVLKRVSMPGMKAA